MNIYIKLTLSIIKFIGVLATTAICCKHILTSLILLDINPIATVILSIWIIYAFTAQFSAWSKYSERITFKAWWIR